VINTYDLDQEMVDKDGSKRRPRRGRFILAIQDRLVPTKDWTKFIIEEALSHSKCRIWWKFSETININLEVVPHVQMLAVLCNSLSEVEHELVFTGVSSRLCEVRLRRPLEGTAPEPMHQVSSVPLIWSQLRSQYLCACRRGPCSTSHRRLPLAQARCSHSHAAQ
jgi:hypothetical protein